MKRLMSLHTVLKKKKGFTLIEILVALGIFTIFAVGIYSGIQFVFKLVYNSRVRILETALLNEQVEGIRNLSFYDVGIVNGSPSGLLERTVTTTRNGIAFEITRTIRNIDDPFDGTAGGDPGDLSPADYKLVDVSIICQSCRQQVPVSVTTYIAPKYLEGDPTHGALFIEVFDANAQAVSGALVTIMSTSTNPTYNFSDTTDNDGMLRIVDLAAGAEAYSISVSKSGYTSDSTVIPSPSNPNPSTLPATVIAQSVTEVSFSIDRVSSMAVETLNESCVPLGAVNLSLTGAKRIGTSPDVLLTDTSFQTSGAGTYTLPYLVWDTYHFTASGYDVIGSIPNETINLFPGTDQPVQLILGTATTNALRVDVVDSVTSQPIANANVTVSSTGYSASRVTGVGSFSQTDWSGGSGQSVMGNDTRFFADDSNVDVLTSSGNMSLRNLLGLHALNGWLESSTFDLGLAPTYQQIIWEPLAQPSEVGQDAVRFQLATATSTSPVAWEYVGPDGTAGTYYTSTDGVIADIHDGDRYMRYKVFLSTASSTYTPTVSSVSFTHTNSCTPPGQIYLGGLGSGTYGVTVSASGYVPVGESVDVSGYTKATIVLQEE
jgi:prepilin-type N-terminal cleavage/methylation domain-containing protein